jgi:formylglycine-generating enzyme required for sulfatase activity
MIILFSLFFFLSCDIFEDGNYIAFPVEMVLIPDGTFIMGNAEIGQPIRWVYLDSYYIGKYEIAFNQYDEYCQDTGEDLPYDFSWGRGRLPVIEISWEEAAGFCNWLSEKENLSPCYYPGDKTWECNFEADGYRLPTEAEWEKAAGWDEENQKQRRWPWGDEWDSSKLNSLGAIIIKRDFEVETTVNIDSYSKGVSYYGLYNMGGNAGEWCNDWYDYDYYQYGENDNPKGPSSLVSDFKVIRGGNCQQLGDNAKTYYRNRPCQYNKKWLQGFRVVRKLSGSAGMADF